MQTLTKEDLENIITIINITAEKGIFKPESFLIIGGLYTKLQDMMKNVDKVTESD